MISPIHFFIFSRYYPLHILCCLYPNYYHIFPLFSFSDTFPLNDAQSLLITKATMRSVSVCYFYSQKYPYCKCTNEQYMYTKNLFFAYIINKGRMIYSLGMPQRKYKQYDVKFEKFGVLKL